MFDLRSHLASYGSAAALGIALLTTTSFHHWTTSAPAYETAQHNEWTGARSPYNSSERPGSPTLTRASFSPNEFHRFP